LELPREIHNKPDHSQGNYKIKRGCNVIVGDAPGGNPAADHNSNVGNEKSKDAEYSEHVENPLLVHFFRWFGTGGKEKNQVSHQEEAGQVNKVTGFK